MSNDLISPGSVVLTIYGVAVVIENIKLPNTSDEIVDTVSNSFKARLWRQPGKSIASSATAYLQNQCVIKSLPAAPGMVTTEENDEELKILIQCYSYQRDEFIATRVDDTAEEKTTHFDLVSSLTFDSEKGDLDDEDSQDNEDNENNIDSKKETKEKSETKISQKKSLIYLKPQYIATAKCAKFYPLIDELINRGNAAAEVAKTSLKQNPKLMQIAEKISTGSKDSEDGKTKNESEEKAPSSEDKIKDKVTDVAEKASESLKKVAPDEEKVNEIYKMLKDEELTVLLKNGRKRLRQLVSGGLTESTHDALKAMGLEIQGEGFDEGVMTSAANEARRNALDALDEIFENNFEMNLESVQETLGDTFGVMFDSMITAAKSDGALGQIMEEIREKTSEWQKETGRLLSTKSSGLFMEGAQRLQARMGNLLSPKQLAMVEKSGADLTKAFTEGDIALAKLKSIELGDSVRSRLFSAIELRSETQGGLDSIIAGAVSQIGGDSVGEMLSNFQSRATKGSSTAHESLISLLSDRSMYHDVSILRIEDVFVHLERQLGEDMTAEQIAAIARGEVGTAALFEPIAKKATKEIEAQLDVAEQSIEDPTILSVISRVRKVMSGSLSLTNLVDEIVNVLNSDSAMQASTSIAQKGEQILDAIESASSNKALEGVFGAVEKAGITKDSVLEKFENLNVEEVLDTAGEAVTDEKKRIELIGAATDSALDFLLRILPSMPVPPFDGVKEGVIYSIKNLSMHGFKLRKEDIFVEIAGIAASQQSGSSADKIVQRTVKATDILIVDVRNVSAVFENAKWAFEQTYMPYLKGNGDANVQLSGGRIRLEFELKKRKRGSDDQEWEPVLCLKERTCSIGSMYLSFVGKNRLNWVANMLANILKGPLRDYVVRVILNIMGTKSGWLLENLNGILSTYWDIILKTTGLNLDTLDEVNKNDIVAAVKDPNANEVDLVWTEFVPLGINLVLNDKSGSVKVVDFPRGSQARKVAIEKEVDPDSLKGAKIIAINGTRYGRKDRVGMLLALRDPVRPKTIKFSLAEDLKISPKKEVPSPMKESVGSNGEGSIRTINIINEGPIGITFAKSIDNRALVVQGFSDEAASVNTGNTVSVGDILTHVNGTTVFAQDEGLTEKAYSCLAESGLSRPLCLGFMPNYLYSITLDKLDAHGDPVLGGPHELKFSDKVKTGETRVVLKGFEDVDGCAEARGVFLGDHLLFVNGEPVGSGIRLRPDSPQLDMKQIYDILDDSSSYPMIVTFARPHSSDGTVDLNLDSTNTKNMSVVAVSKDQLGFNIAKRQGTDQLIVTDFHAVRGSVQQQIKKTLGETDYQGLSVLSVHGEKVPSYANVNIVMNAINRAWTKNDKVEIVLCDQDLKRTISQMKSND